MNGLTTIRNAGWLIQRAGALATDRSGNALVEFAMVLPVMMVLGMYGAELAYMTTVNQQVSQIAVAVADNASRLGQTDNSAVTPTVTNADVDSVMSGAIEQGKSIGFQENGRIILSSLEQSDTGRQYIHWQKCRGGMSRGSAYGKTKAGLTGATLPGMGRSGQVITALPNSAVMFAEVYFDYKPLFGSMFVDAAQFRQEAAFIIRDDRNLGAQSGDGVTGPAGRSECS